jgi:hypothetical protein
VPLIDFIEQRLKSDPVARKILAMDEVATRELDTQALEQIPHRPHDGHRGRGEPNLPPVTMFDHGIDGEVEFKDNDGKASGSASTSSSRAATPTCAPAKATAARSST